MALADSVVSVTGQTVVEMAIVDVMTYVLVRDAAGQSVTVGWHEVTVTSVVL